jgi:hypothetical protein
MTVSVIPARTQAARIGAYGEPMASGQYYLSMVGSGLTNQGMTLNRLYAMPFFVGRACVLDRLAQRVTVAGASSNTIRLGLYSDDNGKPGALLVDAGTADATTTGVKALTVSVAIAQGLYWLATVAQTGTACSCHGNTTNVKMPGMPTLASDLATHSSWTQDSVTGGLPGPFAGTTISSVFFNVAARAA